MDARLLTTAAEKAAGDALIIPVFQGQKTIPGEVSALDRKLKGAISDLLKDGEFHGRLMEVAFVHNVANASSKWTVLVGVGREESFDLVRFRNALHAAARTLRKRGHQQVTVLVPKALATKASPADLARAATEGIALGNFEIGSLKSRHEDPTTQIDALSIIGLDGQKAAADAVKDGVALAEATNQIRDWINAPANTFTPSIFVDKVKAAVKGRDLSLDVLEMDDMKKLKMGALLAVAKGSDEPAKMIVLRYNHGRKGGPMLALVGKGITFDSGGISIKPAQNMEMMKSDMGVGDRKSVV